MTSEVRRLTGSGQFSDALAGSLITRIVERQAATGRMRLVLTGGRTSAAVVQAVLRTSGKSAIDWETLEIWWSDERYLPAGHPQRNDVMVGGLLTSAPGNTPVIYSIAGPESSTSPEDAAAQYAQSLPTAGWDVVMLSLGEDGHVASIFPESPALHAQAPVLAVHGAPKEPSVRVTLSAHALSNASEVWLMASGSDKATAVRLAMDPAAGPLQMPVRAIRGRQRTVWFVDADAAMRLPPELGRRD